MLNINIICIGKLKESYWREAVAEYSKRLSAFCSFSVTELSEQLLPKNPSQGDIDRALSLEGEAILERCPANAAVIALCIEGKMLSSENLAVKINDCAVSGKSTVCFVIGSSFGLSEKVKKRAGLRLSMSPMTFPHQLARVMLCEQIYRAFSINAGTHYHK